MHQFQLLPRNQEHVLELPSVKVLPGHMWDGVLARTIHELKESL